MSMQNEQTSILRDILTELREISTWTRLAGIKELKDNLERTLINDTLRLLYHLSDGTKGTVEIGKVVGLSSSRVSEYWQSWLRVGLGESLPVKGGNRFKRTFDIEDFGLKIPQTPQEPPSPI